MTDLQLDHREEDMDTDEEEEDHSGISKDVEEEVRVGDSKVNYQWIVDTVETWLYMPTHQMDHVQHPGCSATNVARWDT